MVDINRIEDRKAFLGTATVIFLLLLLLIVMGLMNGCSDVLAEEDKAGGVAISLGEPDAGGEDNSAADQQEAYTPPVEEEYTPQHQETSDVAEAPPVQETKPTPKQTETKKPDKPTPKQTEETPKKNTPTPNIGKNSKGSDKTGGGSGGKNEYKGNKGAPDGVKGGDPNGRGGSGGGPADHGNGISGGIGGFTASISKPQGGVQEQGVIRLEVCVDRNGKVTKAKYAPMRGAAGTSTNSALINRAISSIRKSVFKNVSGSSGGCGHFTYTFKLN